MATVAGLFERTEDANDALNELNSMGFGSGAISVAAPVEVAEDNLNGEYTRVSNAEMGNNQPGVLITVIAENGRIGPVQTVMKNMGAVDIDTRYSIWERGDMNDYIDATEEDRDERSSKK